MFRLTPQQKLHGTQEQIGYRPRCSLCRKFQQRLILCDRQA